METRFVMDRYSVTVLYSVPYSLVGFILIMLITEIHFEVGATTYFGNRRGHSPRGPHT